MRPNAPRTNAGWRRRSRRAPGLPAKIPRAPSTNPGMAPGPYVTATVVILVGITVAVVVGLALWQHSRLQDTLRATQAPQAARLAPNAPAPFPIDFVVTWVDSSDPQWRAARAAAWAARGGAGGENAAARFPVTTGGAAPDAELHTCVTSLLHFAPWLRTLWVVTADGQVPPRAASYGPKVRVVHHSAMGLGQVFNSHAIEAALDAIPGLADHFVYGNDDFMALQALQPGDYFAADGRPVLDMEVAVAYMGSAHAAAWNNLAGLLKAQPPPLVRPVTTTPPVAYLKPRHTFVASTKAMWAAARTVEALTCALRTTATHPFRCTADVPPVGAVALAGLGAGLAYTRPPGQGMTFAMLARPEVLDNPRWRAPTTACYQGGVGAGRLEAAMARYLASHGCIS
jgi:hypothetical protein